MISFFENKHLLEKDKIFRFHAKSESILNPPPDTCKKMRPGGGYLGSYKLYNYDFFIKYCQSQNPK